MLLAVVTFSVLTTKPAHAQVVQQPQFYCLGGTPGQNTCPGQPSLTQPGIAPSQPIQQPLGGLEPEQVVPASKVPFAGCQGTGCIPPGQPEEPSGRELVGAGLKAGTVVGPLTICAINPAACSTAMTGGSIIGKGLTIYNIGQSGIFDPVKFHYEEPSGRAPVSGGPRS